MNGILNIVKPTGLTSNDVVQAVKRLTRASKVGHAGTLDPGAAGVLPIMVGTGTRLFDELTEKTKTYVAVMRWGISTDTMDADGRVLERLPVAVTRGDLEKVIPGFVGHIMQVPPAVSAIVVDGRKMYDLARKGQAVELAPRCVRIDSIRVVDARLPTLSRVEIVCARGTYIRSLCVDLARAMGTCGHVEVLLRTQAGPYGLADGITLEELGDAARCGKWTELLRPLDESLTYLEAVHLDPYQEKPVWNGVAIPWEGQPGQRFRVYAKGEFWGIGVIQDEEGQTCLSMKIRTAVG